MTLIESIVVDDLNISFFNGIDFDIIINHPKDGSKGFLICFIENYVKEIKSWERESQIDSLLSDKESKKFDSKEIENNYVAIYQLQGTDIETLYKIIKEKAINRNFPEHPWIAISGMEKGAWRIRNSKVSN